MENQKIEDKPVVFETETISKDELYELIYNHETASVDPRFVHRNKGGVFHYSPTENYMGNPFFTIVKENRVIVGLAELEVDPDQEGVLWLKSISVDSTRKGEGISTKVLDEVFSFAKKNGLKLKPSSYTPDGNDRVKHQIERLSKQYGVEIVE